MHDQEFTIIVNAREKQWPKSQITYDEVVELAFGSVDSNILYAITYRGHGKDGSLGKGGIVEVVNGMIFNVTQTNKS